MAPLRALLRHPAAQRALRAAVAAGTAWQIAVLLPAPLSDYPYYAPLGAIIAVHPTVADSASASWRTVLAILLGSGLAVGVFTATEPLPTAVTLALLVALGVVVEQWRVLGENATWVTFAAVFVLTVGSGDPADFVLAYAGLVLLGAGLGVTVTTLLFPPLHLTDAAREIAGTRRLVTAHLTATAALLRAGETLSLEEERAREAELTAALDRMRNAERTVERARRANPRARRWRESAARIRDEARALDRVVVLLEDVTALVAEFQPHRAGGPGPDPDTSRRLAGALDGLAGVVRTPYHDATGTRPDERDHRVHLADRALTGLVERVQRAPVAQDPGHLALAAVAVGVRRALLALDALDGTAVP